MKEEELFLKAVCLCHTVQINADQTDGADGPWHANGITSPLEYYASSPDEKALVEAASRWAALPGLSGAGTACEGGPSVGKATVKMAQDIGEAQGLALSPYWESIQM